jgi:hypothetical protein
MRRGRPRAEMALPPPRDQGLFYHKIGDHVPGRSEAIRNLLRTGNLVAVGLIPKSGAKEFGVG